MYKHLSEEVIADAAFVAGLMTANTRLGLVPIPVMLDGFETIAFCIKANPPGQPDRVILHPIFIIPHGDMILLDRREGSQPKPLTRAIVAPLDVRHARYYRAALGDPEAFFGAGWDKL